MALSLFFIHGLIFTAAIGLPAQCFLHARTNPASKIRIVSVGIFFAQPNL